MKKILFLIGILSCNILAAQKDAVSHNWDGFRTGQIIVLDTSKQLTVSKTAYSPLVVGVFQAGRKILINAEHQIYSFEDPTIISSGIANVRYNLENGEIKKGDLLTTSNEPGVAMKATKSGVIVGIALEDGDERSGLIKIRVMIQYIK